MTASAWQAIPARFDLNGELVGAEPFVGGHINDSYRLTCRSAGRETRYLLQRINTAIFRQPALLMDNFRRVTAHLRRRLAARGVPDIERRVLTLVPTCTGADYYQDAAGDCWRVLLFIERTRVRETVTTPAQAEQAGRAFGEFQALLADLPGPALHDTIPDFHNTPLRYAVLDRAIAADVARRGAVARAEIQFAAQRRALASTLLDLQSNRGVPQRSVHNDAKMTNVLLDDATGEALCVVDLDIVMPGLSVYDFGDMVRSMTSPTAEDERNLSQVDVRVPLFEGLVRGYWAAAGSLLTRAEREQLVAAGKIITLEQGVRFLTDYLSGDTYYKTQRPGQNLDRARTQFALVASLEAHEAELEHIVRIL